MRALMLAGLVAVAGVAMGGEAAKEPTAEEKIVNLEKRVAGGEKQLALWQERMTAATRAGKSAMAASHGKMVEMYRNGIANDKAAIMALKREQAAAAANPAAAAMIRYQQAQETVAVCEAALAAAKAEMAEAAAAVKATGGAIPNEEPK